MKIWKIAHGNKFFDNVTHKKYTDNQVISIHPNTVPKGQSSKSQGECFTSQDRYLDIFYLCKGNEFIDKIGIFCTIESQLDFLDKGSDWHVRKFITLFEATTKEPYQGEEKWWTPNNNSTFIQIPEEDYELFETFILKPYFGINFNELMQKYDKVKNKIQKEFGMKETMQKYLTLLEQQKNIVLTGAPGTGKTYLAKEIANIMIHTPSKEYDDILLKKINTFTSEDKDKILNDTKLLLEEFTKKYPKDQLNSLTLEQYCIGNGTNDSLSYWLERKLQPLGRFRPGFSSLGHFIYFDKVAQNYVVDTKRSKLSAEELMPQIAQTIHQLISTKSIENLPITNLYQNQLLKLLHSYYPNEYFPVFGATQLKNICISLGIKNTKNLVENNKKILDYFQKNDKFKNIDPILIMYGIYKDNVNIEEDTIEKENSVFVQFHPSYDYTDFVEGLRPVYKENQEIGFKLKDGIFKSFCRQATEYPNNKFVFIIDEINRAELSKVFGELFYSLEPGYRGEKGKVQLQYSNLYSNSENDDSFKDGFYVPENVYIIATMNDIDRSIEPFDFAMKRRFAWCEITPDDTCDNMWVDQDGNPYPWATEAKNRMCSLNNLILEKFSSAYEISGAYFLKLNNLDGDFKKLWTYHLEPVIKDYLRGYKDIESELKKFKDKYDSALKENKDESTNSNS